MLLHVLFIYCYNFSKMILILSVPNDQDTQLVIDWLKHNNQDFFRVNDDDLITGKTQFYYEIGKPDEAHFIKNDCKLFLINVNIVWYRKFRFLSAFKYDEPDLKKFVRSEFNVLSEIIFNLLSEKKWLFRRTSMPNKIDMLEQALKAGLLIPNL